MGFEFTEPKALSADEVAKRAERTEQHRVLTEAMKELRVSGNAPRNTPEYKAFIYVESKVMFDDHVVSPEELRAELEKYKTEPAGE